jgi:hypothetical protein
VGLVLLGVGVGAALVSGPQLWAQAPAAPAPPLSGVAPGAPFDAPGNDEVSPRPVPGPKGEVYRLWARTAEAREGGGAVLLAALEKDAWRTLLEVKPVGATVTVRDPALAVSATGDVALVYRWWRHQPRSKQLRVARWSAGTGTWTQPDVSLDANGTSFEPEVAWGRDASLVVAWSDERRSSRLFDVYARRSPDGGLTWEGERLLSEMPDRSPGELHAKPRLVGDGNGRFWIAWVGLRGGHSAVFVSRSADDGRTWSPGVAVTGESMSVYRHTLHVQGDNLLLVWQDSRTGRERVFATASRDAGATWSPAGRVDHLSDSPAMAANLPDAHLGPNGEAIVVWQDSRNGRDDIYLARSEDGGLTWGKEDVRVDQDDAGTAVSRFPELARGPKGEIAVVWDDDRAGFEAVYLRVWDPDRKRWGAETRLSTPMPKKAARLPHAAWGRDGRLHVAWEVWDHARGLTPTKTIDGRSLAPAGP